jgi:hypothetical protein
MAVGNGHGTNNFKIHLSLVSSAYFYYQVDFDPRYDTSPVVSYGQVHVKLFTVFKKSGLPGVVYLLF